MLDFNDSGLYSREWELKTARGKSQHKTNFAQEFYLKKINKKGI